MVDLNTAQANAKLRGKGWPEANWPKLPNQADQNTNGASDSGLTIRYMPTMDICQVRAWDGQERALGKWCESEFGLALPGNKSTSFDPETMRQIIHVGENQWWMMTHVQDDTKGMAPSLVDALPAKTGSAVDLSHGRVMFMLMGDRAAWVLAKGFAIDLASSSWPEMQVEAVNIHGMPVVVQRVGPVNFAVYGFSSYAQTLREWFDHAGSDVALKWA